MHAGLLVTGLGYAGLPLAREASLAGLAVIVVDTGTALAGLAVSAALAASVSWPPFAVGLKSR